MIRVARDPVYAPCSYLVMRAPFDPRDVNGNTFLVQLDYDFPGIASTFGWHPKPHWLEDSVCHHSGTDGTVDCPDCELTAIDMIADAMAWLDDCAADGREAEDPGYFPEQKS